MGKQAQNTVIQSPALERKMGPQSEKKSGFKRWQLFNIQIQDEEPPRGPICLV